MYPEFIAIYAGLVVVIALLVAVLILLINVIKRLDTRAAAPRTYVPQPGAAAAAGPAASAGKIVFCRHCAAEFDASQMVCPKCGTPR